MGKGIQASFLMGTIHGALKGILLPSPQPNAVLSDLNKALFADFQHYKSFATFLISLYNPKTRMLKWSSAGQNYPLLWKKDTGRCEMLQLKGVMIGIVQPLYYTLGEITLEQGDMVLWYTDGLVELMDKERQLYGVQRVIRILESYGNGGVKEVIKQMEADLLRFSKNAGIQDDISFIAMKSL